MGEDQKGPATALEDQVEVSAQEDQEDQLTALEDQAEDSAQEDTVEAQDSAPEDQAEDSAPEDTGDLPVGEALAAVDRDMESRDNSSTTCIQGSRKILPDPFFAPCIINYTASNNCSFQKPPSFQ